jgi:hypothetical protein
MRTDPLYALPAPLPRDAFFVGPAGWLDPAALATHASVLESDPENALLRLAGDRAADGAARSRLVLIHQDLFAGQQGTERLADWLERVRALGAPLLTVLLHGNLGAGTLVTFFRAGLFDALQLPVERADWVNMLIRAEKRLERRHQNRLILAASEETRDVLQRLRRELDGDEAEAAPELAMASESLEAANRQLTDAMAELSLLYRFGRELSTARNWDRVLRELLRNLSDFVGAGGAALILRSAPGGGYSPRQTWQWDETAWDKVLVNLNDQVDAAVSESIMSIRASRPAAGAGSSRCPWSTRRSAWVTCCCCSLIPAIARPCRGATCRSCRPCRWCCPKRWPAPRCWTASATSGRSTRASWRPSAAPSGWWPRTGPRSTATAPRRPC